MLRTFIGMCGLIVLSFFLRVLPAYATEETAQEQMLRTTRQALETLQSYTAQSLHDALTEGGKGLYCISLQNEEDYARGHIPGAVRLEMDYANPQGALRTLPRDKTIVVTGPDGQSSCQMTVFLRQLGYDARALLLGMAGWNRGAARSATYDQDAMLPVTNATTPLTLGEIPISRPSGLDDSAFILQRTRNYALQGRKASLTQAEARAMQDEALVVSMQTPEDYAYGHIAGAASLPAAAFIQGSPDLLRLPRDKKIIVACYIGHYSNIGAMVLNQMGYEAYSLDGGLNGWNKAGLAKPSPMLQTRPSFPVAKGNTPGSMPTVHTP